MLLPDTNLLVYSYNQSAAQHKIAASWWESTLSKDIPVGLTWVVIMGFIRLTTHPRVLVHPITVREATVRIRQWLEQPSVLLLEPGPKFQTLFLNFIVNLEAGGNMTTDAYLAALAVENQAVLCSNDGDFSRFEGLKWTNPLKNR